MKKTKIWTLRRTGVLHIRGGLGNQLFQLSALSYYSKYLKFQPIIYDFDLTLSQRDRYFPQYQNFNFKNFFDASCPPIIMTKIQGFLFRQFLKLPIQGLILDIQAMDDLLVNGKKPPYFFILRGSFEEDRFPLDIGAFEISRALSTNVQLPTKELSEVAIHIRVSGYGELSVSERRALYRVSERLVYLGHKRIDIYSDDVPTLVGKVPLKEGLIANWPEEHSQLSPPELLRALARYNILVSNGSSISRWANYVANASKNQIFINIKTFDTSEIPF